LCINIIGCGSYVSNIKNCIPQAEFVSSERFQFASRLLTDKSRQLSFDPLEVSNPNNEEYFISRNTKKNPVFTEYDGTKLTIFPQNTFLTLTGEAKIHITWGIPGYFKDDTVYLKGIIKDKTVWASPLYFYDLGDQIDSTTNQKNKKLTGLNNFSFRQPWECPLN